MKNFTFAFAFAFARALPLALATFPLVAVACGSPPGDVEGTWRGKTTACQQDAHNGLDVVIPVLETRSASVVTALGVEGDDIEACTGTTAQLDDAADDLRFEVTRTCNDDELAFAIDLEGDSFGTSQSGTLTVTRAGAPFASCELTVTRE